MDYFLQPFRNALEEASRLTIFETYCSIHSAIDLE